MLRKLFRAVNLLTMRILLLANLTSKHCVGLNNARELKRSGVERCRRAVHQPAPARRAHSSRKASNSSRRARRLPARVASSYIAPSIVEPCTHCLQTTRRRPTNVGKLNADAQKCFSCNQSNFYCCRRSRDGLQFVPQEARGRRVRYDIGRLIDCRAQCNYSTSGSGAAFIGYYLSQRRRNQTLGSCAAVVDAAADGTSRHIRSVTQDETWYMTCRDRGHLGGNAGLVDIRQRCRRRPVIRADCGARNGVDRIVTCSSMSG